MWSKILRRAHSEMLFKGDDYVQGREESIKEAFNYLGIDKKRLLFKGRSTRDELLGAYANIDIALDTSPYPGVTTTCEALWMGVPTVTKDGDNFLTRGGVTIATNSGHRELCTYSEAEYISKAIDLAQDVEQLNHLRLNSRARLSNPFSMRNNFLKILQN